MSAGVASSLPWLVLYSDCAAEDADIIGVLGQPRDEDSGVVPYPRRPPGSGVGHSPVAARRLDLFNYGARERDTIGARAKKLHEGLRCIGDDRRDLNRGRFSTTDIRAKVA